MPLDHRDPAIMALLVQRVEELTETLKNFQPMALMVNTHDGIIKAWQKEESGEHEAMEEAVGFARSAKTGAHILYALMIIFGGVMTATALSMHSAYVDGEVSRARLEQQYLDLKQEVESRQGATK